MAQDSLVKELLTAAMIRAGAELTRKLDDLQWPLLASLWLYESEGNEWKLVLASPRLVSDGPTQCYEKIQSALAEIPSGEGALALSDISVANPAHPPISILRQVIDTGPHVKALRFTRTMVNGRLIEDAYIYRISDTAPTGHAA